MGSLFDKFAKKVTPRPEMSSDDAIAMLDAMRKTHKNYKNNAHFDTVQRYTDSQGGRGSGQLARDIEQLAKGNGLEFPSQRTFMKNLDALVRVLKSFTTYYDALGISYDQYEVEGWKRAEQERSLQILRNPPSIIELQKVLNDLKPQLDFIHAIDPNYFQVRDIIQIATIAKDMPDYPTKTDSERMVSALRKRMRQHAVDAMDAHEVRTAASADKVWREVNGTSSHDFVDSQGNEDFWRESVSSPLATSNSRLIN